MSGVAGQMNVADRVDVADDQLAVVQAAHGGVTTNADADRRRVIGSAADAVGDTQPTLSSGIKELEASLGAVLVERGRGGAPLTPAGECTMASLTERQRPAG